MTLCTCLAILNTSPDVFFVQRLSSATTVKLVPWAMLATCRILPISVNPWACHAELEPPQHWCQKWKYEGNL